MRVIFLHGPPAAGKYTVGVRLSELTGLPLLHNHLAVDTAINLFPFGTPSFRRLRATIWQATFEEAARADQSFIFTFNPESTVDPDLITVLRESIESAGGKVDFVHVTCSRATILARVGMRIAAGSANSSIRSSSRASRLRVRSSSPHSPRHSLRWTRMNTAPRRLRE